VQRLSWNKHEYKHEKRHRATPYLTNEWYARLWYAIDSSVAAATVATIK